MNNRIPRILIILTITNLMWISTSNGFEVETHTLLSQKAIAASQLQNYLTTVLGFEFPSGTGELIGQGLYRRVDELIANEGAVKEDSPDPRVRYHFHDPTKAWSQAGLSSPFLGTFESSVLWSQNPNQGLGGKHSWKDARDSYFNALTSTNVTDRKRYYAETFVTLGHLLHHVQDAAAPSHTRNDWHIPVFTENKFFPGLKIDRFHSWSRDHGGPAINSAVSLPFDPSIFNQTYNGLVPIAGIIDTTTTAGTATPSDATNIGIAEYSNANFFSDDTILRDYAYPNLPQLELTEEPGPDGPATRFYLRKNFGPGPTGYRAAVSTLLTPWLPFGFPTQQWDLDNNVMAEYGALLFPRAIGYSAGLIDYFFRGMIDGVDSYGGTVISGPFAEFPVGQPPTQVTVEGITNYTVGEDTTGSSSVYLVLKFVSKQNTSEVFPEVYVSNPSSLGVTNTPRTFTFDFITPLPFPSTLAGVATYRPYIVYKGRLGAEDAAVVVGTTCQTLDFRHLMQVPPPTGSGEEYLDTISNCDS